MPWVYTGNGDSRRRNRTRVNGRTRRAYRNGGYAAADNDYADYDDELLDELGDADPADGFDGFYDRDGNRLRVTIQTPRDLLPPGGHATVTRGGYIVRGRARF